MALPYYLHKHLNISVTMRMDHFHMCTNIHMFMLVMRINHFRIRQNIRVLPAYSIANLVCFLSDFYPLYTRKQITAHRFILMSKSCSIVTREKT